MSIELLIVDDEVEIRKSLGVYFKSCGYEVTLAENGNAALGVLAVKRIDICISDIIMPIMDGVELLRQVRHDYPMTRVIMITGYVTLENALACMRLGADTCVFKPFEDLSELTSAVEGSTAILNSWKKKLKELVFMKSQSVEENHG